MRKLICYLLTLTFSIHGLLSQHVDTSVVRKIKFEAIQHSEVMDHAFFLTDFFGPRLTGAPAFKAAGEWVIKRLQSYKLENIKQEQFNWGRSWSYKKFAVHLTQPYHAALVCSPGPWSSGTNGFVTGEPILASAPTDVTRRSYESYVEMYKGKLKGKFVLLTPPKAIQPQVQPAFRRFTDDELAKLESTPPAPPSPTLPDSIFKEFDTWGIRLNQFFLDEGVAGLVNHFFYLGIRWKGNCFSIAVIPLRHNRSK